MLNDIIYVIKNIFNYIKHFILIFIKNILTCDFRKGLSFFISAIFFYLLYLLLAFLFSKIKFNKEYNFINSKHNIFLKFIIILIAALIFFLLIFREDKVDEINAKKYFQDISHLNN